MAVFYSQSQAQASQGSGSQGHAQLPGKETDKLVYPCWPSCSKASGLCELWLPASILAHGSLSAYTQRGEIWMSGALEFGYHVKSKGSNLKERSLLCQVGRGK